MKSTGWVLRWAVALLIAAVAAAGKSGSRSSRGLEVSPELGEPLSNFFF